MHSVQSKLSPKTVTVRNIRNRMITFYTAAIIIICLGAALLSVLSLNKLFSERTAGFLIDADAQLCKSADYFTANTETDCADVLKSDTITEYDPVAISYAEYENNSLKNNAGNELLKISAGKNYSDFAVIFSDGSSVGRFSTGTADSLSELSFSGFYELLGDKADKWIFGLGNDFRKIFYLRRITDHSMVLVSMYTAELNNVFITDAPHSDLLLIAADENKKIIYSTDTELASGSDIPEYLGSLFYFDSSDCVISRDNASVSMRTDCGWQLILSSPAGTGNSETAPLIIIIASFAFVFIIIISVTIGIMAGRKYILSELINPASEFTDPLTGALNEYGLDEKISEHIETSIIGSTYAFIILGIKDAKQIKSTLSMRYWNDVRSKLMRITQDFFADRKAYIGRIYDDRIVVFADYSEFDLFKAHESLKNGCEDFRKAFDDFTIGADTDFKLHVSIGACIYPDHAEDFDSLLEKANEAYTTAERSEGDSLAIYGNKKTVKR